MIAETIDHSTLSRLVEAGAVEAVHVVGRPGGWSVVIRYGKAERPLAAQRSRQVRVFKRMDTLVSYLRDVGISKFDVYAVDYAPGTASRPDRAAALRRTHEAAEYDTWFREQVEEAIREADDPNTVWIPHEVVEEEMARQRAELLARLKGEAK
ncbi:hypothetical protein GR239_06335 [Rhizobium leguminosarum]|uniref:hypothetical protein n=1 Tax=Rhizobium ruizarguesonis TaxID=2081791 RepID=UPI0013B996BB|nr:hypothetical protein [Rhizobium ruizarguesonis]MBY5842426.1 hypothetical protein [Rhizobium leguminosarum]NEH83440.1 hypothetical protein [Rhizobium ruizarguesonis]NEI15346.1 hypothetical protein [Rhizobium ruizarguesonis]NEJ56446.1 hypothetical protein [Rhizobium ruizarguesonis]NEJ64219.1 hypothetical protein [Rhizobium ruizarguesonis]